MDMILPLLLGCLETQLIPWIIVGYSIRQVVKRGIHGGRSRLAVVCGVGVGLGTLFFCCRDFLILLTLRAGPSRLIASDTLVMVVMAAIAVACVLAVLIGLVQGRGVLGTVFVLLPLAAAYEAWLQHAGGARWSALS
jgi:predicted Co/Zn/Cd cation transporter (cation efflux family)